MHSLALPLQHAVLTAAAASESNYSLMLHPIICACLAEAAPSLGSGMAAGGKRGGNARGGGGDAHICRGEATEEEAAAAARRSSLVDAYTLRKVSSLVEHARREAAAAAHIPLGSMLHRFFESKPAVIAPRAAAPRDQ